MLSPDQRHLAEQSVLSGLLSDVAVWDRATDDGLTARSEKLEAVDSILGQSSWSADYHEAIFEGIKDAHAQDMEYTAKDVAQIMAVKTPDHVDPEYLTALQDDFAALTTVDAYANTIRDDNRALEMREIGLEMVAKIDSGQPAAEVMDQAVARFERMVPDHEEKSEQVKPVVQPEQKATLRETMAQWVEKIKPARKTAEVKVVVEKPVSSEFTIVRGDEQSTTLHFAQNHNDAQALQSIANRRDAPSPTVVVTKDVQGTMQHGDVLVEMNVSERAVIHKGAAPKDQMPQIEQTANRIAKHIDLAHYTPPSQVNGSLVEYDRHLAQKSAQHESTPQVKAHAHEHGQELVLAKG